MTAIVGILLAAGIGRRFDQEGQRFKLTQALTDDETVIARSARQLHHACDQLIIVHGPRSALSWQATQHIDALHLSCTQANLGMGASLKSAIGALATPSTGWIVALADMPYIDPRTYDALLHALNDGCLLARPRYQQQPGHPVALHRKLKADLLALEDENGAQALFKRYREHTCWIESDDPGCIMDIDVPDDLRPIRN